VNRPEPRVAVRHATDPSRPTVIPASRYDPAVHVLWEEPASVVTVPDTVPDTVIAKAGWLDEEGDG
jgi:hypothetical protein